MFAFWAAMRRLPGHGAPVGAAEHDRTDDTIAIHDGGPLVVSHTRVDVLAFLGHADDGIANILGLVKT